MSKELYGKYVDMGRMYVKDLDKYAQKLYDFSISVVEITYGENQEFKYTLKDYAESLGIEETTLKNILVSTISLPIPNSIPRKKTVLPTAPKKKRVDPNIKTLEEAKHEHCLAALKKCDWNRQEAAKILGISVRGLFNYIKKMNIVIPEQKDIAQQAAKKKFEFERRANKLFPTNEERIHYMDNFPNRCKAI